MHAVRECGNAVRVHLASTYTSQAHMHRTRIDFVLIVFEILKRTVSDELLLNIVFTHYNQLVIHVLSAKLH